ncbi:MAG: hypothetical protein WCG55_00845 [bacterium]
MPPRESFDLNKKSDEQNKQNEGSWLGRNTRKLVAGVALTALSLTPHESRAQKSYSEKDTALHPRTEWAYQDGKDFATHNSQKYPGFVEHFTRNIYKGSKDTNSYSFATYTTEDQLPIDPPEVTKLKLAQKETEASFYANPEVWAKQQVEFQKTPAFRQKVDTEYIQGLDEKIKELEFKVSIFGSNSTDHFTEGNMVKKDSSDVYELKNQKPVEVKRTDEIREMKELRDRYLKNRKEILDKEVANETKTYEQLVGIAEMKQQALQEEIKDLSENYQNTLKYIQDHTKVKK